MKPVDIDDFGFGLMTKHSPTEIPKGAAIVSFDCDYNSRNIMNRRGYDRVLENGPGAIKIANFEAAEAWSVVGTVAPDTAEFVLVEAEVDGTRGRRLSASVGSQASTVLTFGAPQNLGTNPLDVLHLWIKTIDFPATITKYQLDLIFETSAFNTFNYSLAADATSGISYKPENELEVGHAKYHRVRRQDFVIFGTPDWTSITKITFILTVTTGAGTLIVTLDNFHRTPGLQQTLFQFRRETGAFAGATDFYTMTNGTLYKNDGKRWVAVAAGWDASAIVYGLTAQNRHILSDGVTTPRVLMDDGVSVYRLGIATPPFQMLASQIGGGGLPDGDYFAQVLFYSNITGTFSAPDNRVPLTPIITIASGGGNAGIRFANLPVSADPQVTHLVIGIRPATEPSLFFRASDGLYGEVTNGTASFDFTDNLATLLARSLTAIDPDLDYPSVIDRTTGEPVEAHPVFLQDAGGYILAVMAEQPTVLRISRYRQPGSWALDDEFPLGENDQEPLTAIGVAGSHVVAMKRDAVYPGRVIGGDDKLLFDPPISDRGAVSHNSLVGIGQSLFYRAMDGIYRLSVDGVPRKVSDLAQPTWRSLWDPFRVGREVGVAIRDTEQVIHFGSSLGAFSNDIGWVTHFRTVNVEDKGKFPSWAPTLWRIKADVACEVRPQGQDGTGWETWIGGMGQVFRLNYGTEDDNRGIEFEHRTGLVSPNNNVAHLWRFIDVEAMCAGAINLDVRAYLGMGIAPDAAVTVSLKGNAVTLGSFVTGTDKTGAPYYVQQRVNLPVRPATYLSIGIHARARARIEIYKLTPWANPLGARRAVA